MVNYAFEERQSLAKTLLASDPDAPTLCGDWTVRDLVAHLRVRECRVDALPGIALPSLAGHTERVQRHYATDNFLGAVSRFAAGPPWYSPFFLVDRFVNFGEFFIHHEDVRRVHPGWAPRELDDHAQAMLRRLASMVARRSLRGIDARVTVAGPDGETVVELGSGPRVTISGEMGEIALYCFGRDAVEVALDGDSAAIDAVQRANRGV